MGLSVSECDEIIEAAEESGRILMIGQTLRFWPDYMAIADLLKSERLGKPLAAMAKRLAGPPRWADFFLHPEQSGGQVLDLNIHDLDALNWLFGTPKTVFALGQRSPESGGWDLLAVLCERGSVEFSFRAGGEQVDSRDAGGSSLLVFEQGKPPETLETQGGDAYAREVATFVESVRSGQPPQQGTPQQGRLAVATALAARESIESGKIITM